MKITVIKYGVEVITQDEEDVGDAHEFAVQLVREEMSALVINVDGDQEHDVAVHCWGLME